MTTGRARDLADGVTSSLPIYRRVYAVLREEICDGLYPRDDLLPSEAALAERFMTSRITVRKALELLKNEGYTVTRHGVGTFTRAELPAASGARNFTRNLDDMWRETRTELLEFGLVSVPRHVAEPMNLPVGEIIHKAIRLRCYRGEPIETLTTFIRADVARDFTRESFLSAPLSALFAKAGIPSVTARQRITARSADPFTAVQLGLEIGAPVLCMIRVSRDAKGEAISYLRELLRPDRYEIELDLQVDSPGMRAVWDVSELSGEANA